MPRRGRGACLGWLAVTNLGAVPLTDRDRQILDFERSWWSEGGVKETAIQERFSLSAARYYELLAELLDSPAAEAHDPLLVRRLRRLRDARQRARSEAVSAHGAAR